MSVHQVPVGDRPLLGHQGEWGEEVIVTVRQRVPPLIDRFLLLPGLDVLTIGTLNIANYQWS